MKDITEQLKHILGEGGLRQMEPMSRRTTFKAGGPARWFAEPETKEALGAVLALCRENQVPYFILGNGSNLLVADSGFDGVMIHLGRAWSQVSLEGGRIRAGAGATLASAAREALEASLEGLAFAAGIPGTVGGAVVMNAGAYGSELRDVLVSVQVLDREGRSLELLAEELELGYRTSCIIPKEYVVLEAVLQLKPGDKQAIRSHMDELAAKRREKQPLEYPSAGSTFKRPEGYFAGKLIEDAGLRGYMTGGAQVSEKHCGFVINRDNASAGDIYRLCRHVERTVLEQSGVALELEVKLLGNFS
ncbi:MAG: UDP-N-acetylmuramate dehydrogenase [Eubacteriales bacterium]|nr:UDP-N-acetylmuramate dehydrogenase [Eubacteriales bacterium]